MKRCAHCREVASESWTLWACADDRRKRQMALCLTCDIELNALVLTFFQIRGAGGKIARYKKKA